MLLYETSNPPELFSSARVDVVVKNTDRAVRWVLPRQPTTPIKPNTARMRAGGMRLSACRNSGHDKTPLLGGGCNLSISGVFQSPGLSTCRHYATVWRGCRCFWLFKKAIWPCPSSGRAGVRCTLWLSDRIPEYGFWVQILQGWSAPFAGVGAGCAEVARVICMHSLPIFSSQQSTSKNGWVRSRWVLSA